jgi:hypothetical protein
MHPSRLHADKLDLVPDWGRGAVAAILTGRKASAPLGKLGVPAIVVRSLAEEGWIEVWEHDHRKPSATLTPWAAEWLDVELVEQSRVIVRKDADGDLRRHLYDSERWEPVGIRGDLERRRVGCLCPSLAGFAPLPHPELVAEPEQQAESPHPPQAKPRVRELMGGIGRFLKTRPKPRRAARAARSSVA